MLPLRAGVFVPELDREEREVGWQELGLALVAAAGCFVAWVFVALDFRQPRRHTRHNARGLRLQFAFGPSTGRHCRA